MKYMLMFVSANDRWELPIPPEDLQAVQARLRQWWAEHSASGAVLDGQQLQPASMATTVRPQTGLITDGPFLEAKESIGGYAVEAPDLDAVVALARTWPASDKVEVRPILRPAPLAGREREREGM